MKKCPYLFGQEPPSKPKTTQIINKILPTSRIDIIKKIKYIYFIEKLTKHEIKEQNCQSCMSRTYRIIYIRI